MFLSFYSKNASYAWGYTQLHFQEVLSALQTMAAVVKQQESPSHSLTSSNVKIRKDSGLQSQSTSLGEQNGMERERGLQHWILTGEVGPSDFNK